MSMTVDYSDVGSGPALVLLHSSASGNRQWRNLTDALQDRYRIIAVNLYGYGRTSPWPNDTKQSLDRQADLITAAAANVPGPLTLIGHSLGAAVSVQAALALAERMQGLILFEPILFYMLDQHGPAEAFAEISALATEFCARARRDDWDGAGALFVDYWSGEGTWAAMPAERQGRTFENIAQCRA